MINFNYKEIYNKLLGSDIVSLLSQIHEYRGKQNLFDKVNPDEMLSLVEIAKIQSTEASNRIEGIITTSDRLKKLVNAKTTPNNRSEKEIAGYRDVLATIHDSYNYIPVKTSIILQLHRDLYKFTGMTIGGNYKISDNVILEERGGEKVVRFQPLPAWETPEAMDRLCKEYESIIADPEIDPLLIIPMFVLDFLCIHPFSDGNGRMSRLLTLLLLYRSGYTVGKYISLEKIIADSKETYYEVLQESSDNWNEGKNDYAPFVKYLLGVILSAYRELVSRMELLTVSKSQRVRVIIKDTLGQISKADIITKCPDVSEITVERALKELLDNNEIIKIGGGRYTKYVWNYDKEN